MNTAVGSPKDPVSQPARRFLKTFARTIATTAVLAVCQIPVASAQHLLDGFNTPLATRTGYPGDPGAVAVQRDGKIVIAGQMRFDSPWLEPSENVVRLMVDGAPDPSFGVGFDIGGFGSQNVSLLVRSDGRLLLAAVPNGDPARVALLEPDGTDVFIQEAINGTVHALAEDIDGTTLIAGAFTAVVDQPRAYLARLNADGSLDGGFIATDINGPITELIRQPDGRLVIAGDFTAVGGETRNRLARLNADGSLDPSFGQPTGANGPINALALQADGKLVVAGDFSAIGHSARNRIARLNADGSVDAGFDAGSGPDGVVHAIVIRPDGCLIVTGGFLSFDGQARPYRIAQLKPSGELDTAFGLAQSDGALRAVGIDAPVIGLALQSDDRLLAIGPFTEVDGVARGGLARFNVDGSPDVDVVIEHSNFVAGGNFVNTIHQPDGKMLISGSFDTVHHVGRRGLARLNADGTLDTSFDSGAGPQLEGCIPAGQENCVRTVEMVLQLDGTIIIYGIFDTYDNVPLNYGLARLNADGSLDPTYQPHLLHPIQPFGEGPVIEQAMLQSDGKLIMEGLFQSEADGGTRWMARFNPDGSIDPGFDPYDGFEDDPAYYQIRAERFALLSDDKIVVKVLGKLCPPCQWTLRNMIRLHPNGSVDEGFFLNLQEPLEGDLVNGLHAHLDDSVLISGTFTRVNGQSIVNLGRFRYDGTPDPGFFFDAEPSTEHGNPSRVYTYGIQADESALIGTSYHAEIQGIPITARVQRVSGTGLLDFKFDFSPPQGLLTSGAVADVSPMADGRWSMVGDLNTYDFTQIPYHNIGRFTTQEPVLQSLQADPGLARIDWLRSGNSPALEYTHFEISLDGETWIQVGRGQPIPGGAGLSPVHSTVSPPKRDAEPQVPPQGRLDQKGALDSHTQFNGEKSARQPDVPTAQIVDSDPSGIAGRIASLMRMASLAAVGEVSGAQSDATAGQAAQTRNRYAQAAHYTAAASLADLSASQPSETEVTSSIRKGSPDLAVETVGSIVRNAVVGQAFAQPLQVAVRDENGLVSGVEVIFAAPASGPTASLSSTTVTTDAFGFAEVNATAGNVAGGYTVTATLASGSQTAFHLANLPSNDIAIAPVGNDSQSTPVNEPFPQPLTVRVTDQGGQPVAGAGLWFTTVPGGSGQDAALAGCIDDTGGLCWAVADANGEASVQATANAIVGDYQAGAVVVDVPGDPFALFNLTNTEAGVGTPQVVISQIFTAGGGAFSHDYIELFNAGDGPQDLGGWSVQYASGRTSTTWVGTDLTGIVLSPGEYYLVQGAIGSGAGTSLPAPDATGSINLGNVNGRVALVASSTLLTDVCPTSNDIIDFLGYDTTGGTVCAWGSPGDRPSSNALLRLDFGCTNTQDNGADFQIGSPNPRNTASAPLLCHERPPLAVIGGSGQATEAGSAFAELLVVRLTDTGGNPVQGAEISFTAPATGASAFLSATTVTTDGNGEASVAATANDAVGSYVVSASSSGRNVEFHLLNEPNSSEKIVISQVWGGGGLNGAPYTHDFVELFNAGDQPVDMTSWFFRWYYPSAWRGAVLPTTVLQPGQYYLIQLGSSSPGAGVPLPEPDLVVTGGDSINLPQTDGRIVLLRLASDPGNECPTHVGAVDLVGYGNQTDCAWAAPAPTTDAQIAAIRSDGGCRQSGDNEADFVGGAPQPRNSASPLNPCTGGVDLRIEAIGGTPQGTAIGQPFTVPLAVRVTDRDGNPAVDEAVTFVLPATDDATALPGSIAAITDGNGEAHVTATANPIAGSYHARAYTARSGVPAIFALSNTDTAWNLELVGGTPQSAEVDEPFAEPLVVRVTDSGSGLPVENAVVTFSAPSAGPGAVLSATTVATNSGGEASVMASANAVVGSYSVTVSIGAAQVNFDLTNTAPTDGPRVVISQVYRDNTPGSGSPYKNFIELFNAGTEYESLHGWSVQSRTDSGGGGTAVTPLPGIALQPGQRLLIGYLSDGDAGAVLPPPDVVAPGNMPAELVALASDLDPLTGECPAGDPSVVDFVGTGSVDCAWGTPVSSPPSLQALVRNDGGCAQTANNAADFSAGNPLPRNSTAPFTPCDGSGPGEIDVAILSGDNQSIRLNRLFGQPLRVRLTRGGTPVVGQAVSYLAMPSSEGATAALSATTVVTNNNGEASVTATSNAVVGSHVVRGVIGLTHVDFDLTNVGQIVLRSFPVQSAPLNSPFRDIRVQVNYGGSSDVLPDIPVQFSVSDSGGATALLSAATVVTDSNGEAVVRAAANGLPGSYQVTASIAGSTPPVTIDMTNADPAAMTQPWDGWSISDVNLPRNRNVWIRVRGFTADGSIHESVKVFYPTGGFTATPTAGEGGRIEPPIPQGGNAGDVLSFTIVPDEGFGIGSVTGCDGSLNGSTYLTGPLSADCEIVVAFAGDVETFTVTASAGPGGSIEPDGPQSVTEGETVSFLLLPQPEHVIADVGGTCGGELADDVYTTEPVMADCTVEANFELETVDDRLFANGFEQEMGITH